MFQTLETTTSLANTISQTLESLKPKTQDEPSKSKILDAATALASAALDITTSVPKITAENVNDDTLDTARASVINANMAISVHGESLDSGTRGELDKISECLQKNVRRIKNNGSENHDAADKLVIAAIRLSGEAAKGAGRAGVGGNTVAAAVRIAGSAAVVAGDRSGIVSNSSGNENAIRVVVDAARIADEAAKIPAQGEDDTAGVVRVAADIANRTTILKDSADQVEKDSGEKDKQALGRIQEAIERIQKEAANIAAESAAGLLAKLAGDVGGSTLLGALPLGLFGKDIINRILAELFKLFADPNVVVRTAGDMFLAADDQVIRDFIFNVTKRSFSALRGYLGRAPAIYEEVFKDSPNWDAMKYIIDERSQLAEFLIDLIEPAKEFAASTSPDGAPKGSNNRELNEYNELNLHKPMNRYAVICQVQRLVKSIVIIFDSRQKEASLDKLEMNTKLELDNTGGSVKSDVEDANFRKDKEKWFFVNGVGGEPFWVKSACNRISETFKREVTGIFNRSEGLLWDLVECAGGRNKSDEGPSLVDRTESSRRARKTLKDKLQATSAEQIAVIAHSQGCLLLRLVLQDLQKNNPDILQKLRVFTFGNPSYDWDFELGHTEHFYNEKDFIAKLGVGRKGARDAYTGTIFTNSSWTGHLFNAQYSFDPKHYDIDIGASKLLSCSDGSNPQPLAVKKPKPKPPPEPEPEGGDEESEEPEEKPESKPKPKPKPKAESESEEKPPKKPKPKPKPKPKVESESEESPLKQPKPKPKPEPKDEAEESPLTPEY
ncbi:hypothetical protein BJY04DRAFT_214144 [Aspergillus karnatakaensis]|uniref:uncharacterized protein n=1 Tax=Aspergillus karnatakaensis TaxID=1810916 RepID=UPI003CCCF9B1